MPLYEVLVADVITRYVEASSRKDAAQLVRDSVNEAMTVNAKLADPLIEDLWKRADQQQRLRLLARLDGLSYPVTGRRLAETKARLERQLAHEQATLDWISNNGAKAPPSDPAAVSRLAALLDAGHRRWLLDRLR